MSLKIEQIQLKRLSMFIAAKLHSRVKMDAARKNMSMTEWISQAIEDKLRREEGRGIEL